MIRYIDADTWKNMRQEEKEQHFRDIGARYPYRFYSRIKHTLKYQHKPQGKRKRRRQHNMSIRGNPIFNSLTILEIFEKCNYTCQYCGIEQNDDYIKLHGRLTLDRINSDEDYSLENCVLACKICNQIKGNLLNGEETTIVGKIIKQAVARRHTELLAKYGEDYVCTIHCTINIRHKKSSSQIPLGV